MTDGIESLYDKRTLIFRSFFVVAYVIAGSGIFHVLERDFASIAVEEFEDYFHKTMTTILNGSISNKSDITRIMQDIRHEFLEDVFPRKWDAFGGLNISVQAITTIGYGNTVPKTTAGRMFLIIYSMLGIPLMAMMLTTWGEKMKHVIKLSVYAFETKLLKRATPQNIHKKSLVVVFVIAAIVLCTISAISAVTENWDFSLALYVCFVTFSTIGFGDYVPKGTGSKDLQYVVIHSACSVVSFFCGLVLIATIIHTISDWVNSKTPPTKKDIKQSISQMTSSLSAYISKEETTVDVFDETSLENNICCSKSMQTAM